MRTGAYHFAERARELPESARPHCILASDYLNVAEWRALTRPLLDRTPVVLYFHENQATYPLAEHAPAGEHFAWINLSSASTADAVLFNSHYHRQNFLEAVRAVERRMPPPAPKTVLGTLENNSTVFPVGIDFAPHDRSREQAPSSHGDAADSPLTILWNHRWEYDKAPEVFIDALVSLKRRGKRFRLILCGGRGADRHPAWLKAREELCDEIVVDGFLESQEEYLDALVQADIVASTARHEFFGVSVAEAIYMDCLPLLPHALSYPELIPSHLHEVFLYDPATPFRDALERFLNAPPTDHHDELRTFVSRFDWRRLAPQLDTRLHEVTTQCLAPRQQPPGRGARSEENAPPG